MTDEMMNLRALLEKSPDADLLHEMIGFASQHFERLRSLPTSERWMFPARDGTTHIDTKT